MISTGEPLTRDLAARLLPKGSCLWNLYGPTETTIWSTGCQITSADGPISIGRPIAKTQSYVLDASQQPVPIGVPGELYLGGDGLARCYLNRPELTAEKFVPNPFTDINGSARLYRTGDVARWRADGTLECLGRMDHQVKIRGFRIELGEVESVLSQHPGVRQAVVTPKNDGSGDKRLVAYLVARGAAPPVMELREHLKRKVPDYMVPSGFVYLETLPLTNNGKVDRRALPEPQQERPEIATTYVAPRTETEIVLARIWSDVLQVEQVGLHDDFFEFGGHSILAVKAVSRMRQQLETEVPLSAMFECPTVAEMALKMMELEADRLDPADLVRLLGEVEAVTQDKGRRRDNPQA
jgi:hypothetical protein